MKTEENSEALILFILLKRKIHLKEAEDQLAELEILAKKPVENPHRTNGYFAPAPVHPVEEKDDDDDDDDDDGDASAGGI